ncbi:hypothetical protein ACFY0A_38305 [Streptomyces sp. NPDC001698]|uniref:hypothetical protein n=1 Tax=Streptomyces sp. NPDC001698 TaxID=3364601 RepID=UPI0036C742C1
MDLKQVQAGIAACADGGIPVHAKVFDGGAAKVSQIIGAMRDLRQLVGQQELLMVADSKLVSYHEHQRAAEAEGAVHRAGPGRPDQRRGLCQPRS